MCITYYEFCILNFEVTLVLIVCTDYICYKGVFFHGCHSVFGYKDSKHLNCVVVGIHSPLMKLKMTASESSLTNTALIQMRLFSSNGGP